MLILRRFSVEGVSPFKKKQVFEFKPGISVVYGLNKVTPASRNGNGSGKSRLLKTVPGVIFPNPLTGTAKDRVKTGVRTLELSHNGEDYSFVKTGSKLKIYNSKGKPVGRSVTETREWLAQNLDLNEEKFAATTYIDALRHHPLVKGTTPERKLFLNQFFELDKIDRERKLINGAVSKLSHVQQAYIDLEQRSEKLTALLEGATPLAKLKSQFEKSSAKLQQLQDRAAQAMEIRRLVEFMKDNKELIQQLDTALAGDKLTEDRFSKIVKQTREELGENTERLELAQAWHEYKLKFSAYEAAVAELPKSVRRALNDGKAESAQAHYTKYLDAKERLSRIGKISRPEKPERVDEPGSDLVKCVADLTRLEIQYKHAQELNTGSCPTCGQDVKLQNPDDMKNKIRYLKGEVNRWEDYRQYKRDRTRWKEEIHEYEQQLEEREKLQKRMEAYKEGYELHLHFRELPVKPKEWTGKRYPLKEYSVMVEQDRERLRTLKMLHPNIQLIIDYRALDSREFDADVLKQVGELADRHASIGAELELTRERRRQLKQIQAEMEELEADRRTLRDLKTLAQGYSDKVLKRMAVNQISSLLMAQVNKFASRVFPEDFRFEMNWESSDIDILVHRRFGKRVETSDVRELSGAESRLLTYVMVLALMTFIPESKRSSVLIMDEPTANMSPEIIESFKQLLEVMATVIPTVVVVTPMPEEVYDGATCYTVVKRNGLSTIVEGHPSTIRG